MGVVILPHGFYQFVKKILLLPAAFSKIQLVN